MLRYHCVPSSTECNCAYLFLHVNYTYACWYTENNETLLILWAQNIISDICNRKNRMRAKSQKSLWAFHRSHSMLLQLCDIHLKYFFFHRETIENFSILFELFFFSVFVFMHLQAKSNDRQSRRHYVDYNFPFAQYIFRFELFFFSVHLLPFFLG